MAEAVPRGFQGEPSEVWEWDPLPRSWKVITTDAVHSDVPGRPGAFINAESQESEYWQKLDW